MKKTALVVGINDPRLPERFWNRVKVDEDGCWIWQGPPNAGGYGQIFVAKGEQPARCHTLAYATLVGPIPEGFTLDHLCHNESDCPGGKCKHRLCVNPAHMEPVTRAENVRRGKRWAILPTTCKRGHPYGPNNENRFVNGHGCRLCRKERS